MHRRLVLAFLMFLFVVVLAGCGGGGGGGGTVGSTVASSTSSEGSPPAPSSTPATSSTPAPAPQPTTSTGKLAGRIVDSVGNGLAGRPVSVSPKAAKTGEASDAVSATTDAGGGFTLTGLTAGRVYTLTVTGGDGFPTLVTEFQLMEGTDVLEMQLSIPAGSGTLRFGMPPPLLLDVPSVESVAVHFSWRPSTDPRFVAYNLYRSSSPRVTTADTQVASNGRISETSATEVPPAGTQYYRLFEKVWVQELSCFVEVGTNVVTVEGQGGLGSPTPTPEYVLDASFATTELGQLPRQSGHWGPQLTFVVDAHGNVEVPMAAAGASDPVTVGTYDPDGKKTGELSMDGVDLAIDANGDFWACRVEGAAGTLSHYTPAGTLLDTVSFTSPDTAFFAPCQLAVDVTRRVAYLSRLDYLQHMIAIDLASGTVTVPRAAGAATGSVALDPSSGRVFGMNNAWSFMRFDAAMNMLGVVTTRGIPTCLAIGQDQSLYVMSGMIEGVLVSRYTVGGTLLTQFVVNTPTHSPNYNYLQVDGQGRVYVRFLDTPITRWVPKT